MQTALQKTFAHLDKGEFDKVSAKDLYRLVYALGVFRVRGPPLRRALAAVTPALLEAYRNGKGAEIGCEGTRKGLVRIAWCIGRVIGDNDEDWCETPEWKQVQRLLKGTAKEVRLLLDSLDNKDLLILEDVYGKAEANYKPFLKDVKAAKATISYYGAPPPPKRHINDPRRDINTARRRGKPMRWIYVATFGVAPLLYDFELNDFPPY
ncbi:hypothetical protein Pmar_PMAR001103 [Perkinsus marinus ATCC 50983]|uniref:Uncharacterized protein n=1 Tax=Perkinsus marinus (strain ATCC 50983 / TXsc) TaxID=423536 RepID=C5KSV6_PERM5|nr:hypothetical protein Pmar_PMAR001103 [Perkinsus marinus ATCC 50983]EER12306.1 hypothetical protein Pmar_PMAR001103 [Perkinsus marinus ATCC 50983]|eukprot:XP_002780511.1 hypothetical protein Pmar_PMAR001103 [Perkinsus marinus ATCC 50983]